MRYSVCLLLTFVLGLHAQSEPKGLPRVLSGIGIDQKLDAQLPLTSTFLDENGKAVPLSSYFGKKPVLLTPVYYTCPMLCNQILSGLVTGLRPLSLQPGRDFEIVAFSINPADAPADARAKRDHFSKSYSSRLGTRGWHFLTGSQQSIQAVANAIGFHYRWDPAHKMFVHASGIMMATAEGRLVRYFYGVEYEPKDLKLGLIEASHRQIGSPVDQILLYCYHYDPTTGKYGAVVVNMLRGAAAFVLLALLLTLIFFWRRDIREDRRVMKGTHHA